MISKLINVKQSKDLNTVLEIKKSIYVPYLQHTNQCKRKINFTFYSQMIIGIGTDLVEVSRIEKLVLESNGFKERVFSPIEISYCESGKNRFERYAARFAAKEAFAKALGIGIFGGIPMNAVSVIHGENQKPELQIDSSFADQIPILEGVKVLLSISHTATLAIAFVVLDSPIKATRL